MPYDPTDRANSGTSPKQRPPLLSQSDRWHAVQNRSSGRQDLRRTATINQGLSVAGPRQTPSTSTSLKRRSDAISQADGQVAHSNADDRWHCSAPVYDPSCAPTPSVASTNPRTRSQVSSHTASYAGSHAPSQTMSKYDPGTSGAAHKSALCVVTGRTRKHFRKGDIIGIPFHSNNTNPNVDQNDRRLTQTCEGPAYSKRRMMVGLWIHQQDMFCLPLYTFQGRGLSSKPPSLRHEYVCMMNVGQDSFKNLGQYPPVEVVCRKRPMDDNTCVHLTDGLKVACNDDISFVGRMTRDSHANLIDIWQLLIARARDEA